MTRLKTIKLILFSFGLILSVIAEIDLDSHWCYSCDDPHLHTFDGSNYEFQYYGNNYIMYTDYLLKTVTASFSYCNNGLTMPTCNCGVNVQSESTYLYFDVCNVEPNPLASIQFYYYDVNVQPTPEPAHCDSKLIPVGMETNDAWWNTDSNTVNLFQNIQCAKSELLYETYFIKTNTSNGNIYVKVMVHESGISCLYIRPSLDDFNASGGLCGLFNDNSTDDLFVWSQIGAGDGSPNSGYEQQNINSDYSLLKNFWQLAPYTPMELYYKRLDEFDCPCDAPGSSQVDNNCNVLLSECVLNKYNLTVVYQDYIRSNPGRDTANGGVADLNDEICTKRFEETKLKWALDNNMMSQEKYDELMKFCIMDFGATQDEGWVINLIQVGYNIVLEGCATNWTSGCERYKQAAKCLNPEYTSLFDEVAGIFPCPAKVPRCKK